MTRNNKAWLLAGSHLAVAAIGLFLARPDDAGEGTAADSKQGSANASPALSSSIGGKGTSRQASRFKPSASWRGGEFARAWKAMRTAKLSTTERLWAQQELLKQWAEVDLAAAIDAALAEAWDSDHGDYYDPTGPLLGSLADALAKDPAHAWDMIRGRQFGLGTGMVRNVWIQAVGQKDPLFLASKLGELSWRDRETALGACRNDLRPGCETEQKLFELLARFPDDVVSTGDLLNFDLRDPGEIDPEQLKQELLSLGAQDERMARVRAVQWGRLLAHQSPEEIEAQLATIPEAVRQEVVWSAFGEAETPASALGLATLLADEGAWEKLEEREMVGRIQNLANQGAAKEVADWATGLPVRAETTELFHRSVDRYLRDNLDGAREWLAEIPPGVWRDRAYAEYSQQALNAHNNPEASRWALDQIGDTTFKREAEGWRSQWEKRTGWQAQ